MKEQLTEEQIEKLFKFVKSKYVHFIDVQHEIVDHLASAIEEKQREDPNLSFNRALNMVYAGFPITGFGQLTAEKHNALTKFWRKKFIGFMLQYLKLPKIAIFAFLSFMIYHLLQNGTHQTLWFLYVSIVLFSIGSGAYRYIFAFEFNKDFREKYLVTNTYFSMHAGFYFIYFYIPVRESLEGYKNLSPLNYSETQSWLFAIYFVIILLWIHAAYFEFPKMLKKEIEEKYHYLNLKLT